MRVAALYDIHGNLPALEAVLAEVEREGVDAIVIGGDIASGPPQPREVVELVRSLPNAHCIRGNADRLFDEEFAADEGLGWLLERLDDEQARWLASLPSSVVLDDTLYVHATPVDDTTIVTERTTDEKLAGLLRDVEQPRVVAGHTHMQLERRVGEKLFVNAGSVGWPYEGIPGSYWAILDEGVALRHTDYDRERAAELVRACGHPRADEVAAENILASATREEALEVFGG
jgi:putative phosphoesterase